MEIAQLPKVKASTRSRSPEDTHNYMLMKVKENERPDLIGGITPTGQTILMNYS